MRYFPAKPCATTSGIVNLTDVALEPINWSGLVDLTYFQKRNLVCGNRLESVHD